MDEAALRLLLDDVRSGIVAPDDAVRTLRRLPYADLGYARVDHHRSLRQGRPEAVYAPGKTPGQCAGIVAELLAGGDGPVILSRADPVQVAAALAVAPEAVVRASTVVWRAAPGRQERVLVLTAGTADLPVAEECAATLAAFGFAARLVADVGVAGLHRLLAHVGELQEADAVVVIAGMEGALASVVGGLTAAPVVAVPTSTGYGASLEGVTALLGMLATCASGVTVVGIDNGFGAAQAVARWLPTGAGGGGEKRKAGAGKVPRRGLPVGGRVTTTAAWWHCFSGIAGDMALGSLVDAGVGLDLIERELAALPVGGWALESRPVLRGGLAATQVLVHVQESTVVRTHAHIVGLITEARLPERARRRALATFALLAEVEGRLHRRPPAQVHFHEVGGVDAIVDIVGTCVALELLGVDEIHASAVAQGTGMIRAAHGLLPNPSPAVLELLREAPTYGTDSPVELTTPTGAALLAALGSGWGPMPAMEVTAVGRGAGGRDPEGVPNLVQVVIGRRHEAGTRSGEGHPVVLVESNVDDVTGEILADTVAALLAAGAHDAWITPVVGKKGRPAHVVSAVGDPVAVPALRRALMAETGTLGVRTHSVQRWVTRREVAEVEVDGFPVRVKRSPGRIKAEHDDAARVAARTGRPVREVSRLAEQEAHRRADAGGGAGDGDEPPTRPVDRP